MTKKLTGKAIADLATIAQEVATNATIKGLVITSGKTSGFCAGADLGELGGIARADRPEATLDALGQDALALGGQAHATDGALEQGDAQVALQRLQLQGDGRLADEKRLRRP